MGRVRTRVIRLAWVVAACALLAVVVVSPGAAMRFREEPCPEATPGPLRLCPDGFVGKLYSKRIEVEPGGGTAPYTYKITGGALPPGLSLNGSTGDVTGTPTVSGTAFFTITATDSCPSNPGCLGSPSKSTDDQFRVIINPELQIQTKSLPTGASVGVPYSVPLQVLLVTNTTTSPPTGSVPSSVEWSIASGTLPPGLAIANGVLSGTPTTEGSYQFVVQAKSGDSTDTETLALDVRTAVAIQAGRPFAPAPAPTRSEVSVPFSGKLTGSGGTGTYTWALTSGALPAGLALGQDGSIVGTPRAAGSFPFAVGLTDNEGRTASYQTTINVAAKLAVGTTLVRPAKVGRLYKFKLKTTGGVLPVKWKVKSGTLPRGIKLASRLGVFTGKPRKAGTYRVVVEVTDALKVTSQKRLTLTVLP